MFNSGVFQDIKNNPKAAVDRLLGPSYDYTTGIKRPEELGVSDEGSLGQVFTNANAVKQYTQQLITGPLLGNTTFVETGGKCRMYGNIIGEDGKDIIGNQVVDAIVPRWSYVDNRMGLKDAVDVLPGNLPKALGGTADVFQGIVPGMMGDIASLNPVKPINGLVMDGIPPCVPLVCPVTDINGNNPRNQTRFVTPELEMNIRKCRALPFNEGKQQFENIKNSNRIARERQEEEEKKKQQKAGFDTQFDGPYSAQPFKLMAPTDLTPYVFWGFAVVCLAGVIIQKL